mgnify:CR=1 FL=1
MVKRILLSIVMLVLIAYLVVAVSAFNRKPADQTCRDMELVIKDTAYAGFITKDELKGILQKKGIYPIGKKIADELHKAGYTTEDDFLHLGEKPSYEEAVRLAGKLMELFSSGKADRVELLYHHFKNMATQVLTHKVYLPVTLPQASVENTVPTTDYILEPSPESLQALLFPKLLNLTIYTTLLDTTTSEHAARMMAMQTANDNANDLIQELTLQYNKTRQQAITNELLDIMGGQ